MNVLSKYLLLILLQICLVTPGRSQVTQLWESNTTYGDKGTLYLFGGSTVQYYFVLDTVAGQCRIFHPDNFSLVSTLSSLGHFEYPYILVPDMNGNGQPEIVFQDYAVTGYAVRIRDCITGAEVKSWKETLNSYYLWSLVKSPGNSVIKISMYKTNLTTYQSSLIVFSLGVNTTSAAEENWNIRQSSFQLHQNYPNPFNPSTVISFDIPEDALVTLSIYDALGRLVSIVIDDHRAAGHYNVPLRSENLPSGTYYYKISAGSYTSAKKMIIIK